MRILGAGKGVKRLHPPRADELYSSQHLAVLVPDILCAVWFIPFHIHPFQVLVKAELIALRDTYLEFADTSLKVPLPCFGSREFQRGAEIFCSFLAAVVGRTANRPILAFSRVNICCS